MHHIALLHLFAAVNLCLPSKHLFKALITQVQIGQSVSISLKTNND